MTLGQVTSDDARVSHIRARQTAQTRTHKVMLGQAQRYTFSAPDRRRGGPWRVQADVRSDGQTISGTVVAEGINPGLSGAGGPGNGALWGGLAAAGFFTIVGIFAALTSDTPAAKQAWWIREQRGLAPPI
jgi:hypothetical protein